MSSPPFTLVERTAPVAGRNDPCPCQSGKKYKRCCLQGVGLVRRAPPSPPTGFAHLGCYAASLCDCSQKLSGEHPIGEALLKRLRVNGGVQAAQFPWLAGSERHLPPDALQARMLCTRHNSALSELDQLGLNFFMRLEAIGRAAAGVPFDAAPALFNGRDLERWLLKIAAGFVAAGWTHSPSRAVPSLWAEVIWGDAALEEPDGMYLEEGATREFHFGLKVSLVSFDATSEPAGVEVEMLGHKFLLMVGGANVRPPVASSVRRRRPTDFVGPNLEARLDYGDARTSVVRIEVNGEFDGDPDAMPDSWRRFNRG